jgi:NADH dehydrogenase FAD-containing subunit
MAARAHVVVAGGGFAGLETAFLLRHRMHDEVRITLVSDQDHFLFRPNTIYIPFGASAEDFQIPLSLPTQSQHIELVSARVHGVDPVSRRLELDGRNLTYDKLVIATGAAMSPHEVPGLAEHAASLWTPGDMLKLRSAVERITDRAKLGRLTHVLFLIPPNNKCAGPLYELVFMLETHLRRQGVRTPVKLTWATAEHRYLQAFGPRLHQVVDAEFTERGIEGHVERVVEEVQAGRVKFRDGATLDYDELIAFPPYVSAVRYDGLPQDERGFLKTDLESRAVAWVRDVYAPGDAGDFPVKQAFLAFLQADATAEHIVADLRGTEPRVRFDPVSMCIMEQFDKAVFAQAPLRLTGEPDRPVEVRPDALDQYKVGVSPTWRLGKKLLGVYLPMRFRAGEPFHAGASWKMMDVGLKTLSGMLAQ